MAIVLAMGYDCVSSLRNHRVSEYNFLSGVLRDSVSSSHGPTV